MEQEAVQIVPLLVAFEDFVQKGGLQPEKQDGGVHLFQIIRMFAVLVCDDHLSLKKTALLPQKDLFKASLHDIKDLDKLMPVIFSLTGQVIVLCSFFCAAYAVHMAVFSVPAKERGKITLHHAAFRVMY